MLTDPLTDPPIEFARMLAVKVDPLQRQTPGIPEDQEIAAGERPSRQYRERPTP
jgi:hypothetical protein